MSGLRRLGLACALLLACGLSLAMCERVGARGRFTGAYSSYGSGPLGTRALFLLAEQLGARPERWAEDFGSLPAGAGMLVALSDCEAGMARGLSRYEESELDRFVRQGGVLLVAGARYYLPASFGVSFESEPHCSAGWHFVGIHDKASEGPRSIPGEAFGPPRHRARDAGVDAGGAGTEEDADSDTEVASASSGGASLPRDERVLWSSPVGEPLLGLDPVPMRRPGKLKLEDKLEREPLLSLAPDDPASDPLTAGAVVHHGRGRVIVLASASMLQNRALEFADGGLLFARLLRRYAPHGPVFFDEYHLGVGERRSLMRYLRSVGALPWIAQLLLCAGVWLWRSGARFGGMRSPPEPPPQGTASFVSALGRLFARARDPGAAIRILSRQALARVSAYHHLGPSSARNLARELEQRGLPSAAAAVLVVGQPERVLAESRGLARASQALDQAVARACQKPEAEST